MFPRFYIVFLFVNIFIEILALVELPQVEENNILETDTTIRQTTNQLFLLLKLKVSKDQQNLKQYSLIHNYLVSASLQDYTNLREIAKLTRVDKTRLNNETQNFMTIVNEILNEDVNHDTVAEYQYVITHIEGFLTNLENYTGKNGYSEIVANDIFTEIVKILERKDTFKEAKNETVDTNGSSLEANDEEGNLIDDYEFWVPNARRIFQGERTTIKDFPFMASIQVFNQFQCAGSIIKSDLVITAASCLQLTWNNRFFRENPNFLTVRVGSSLPNSGGEKIEVLEVYFHPDYEPQSLKNNLCILSLQRKLKIKKKEKRIKKIAVDRKAHGLPITTMYGPGIDITIVGWGAKGIDQVAKDQFLSFSVLDVYPVPECQAVYSSAYVTQKHFCAGFLSRGSGACSRDIGGPGIVNGILVGVVSFGSAICGTPDAPTVFTKLGFYADWIDSIIQRNAVVAKKRTTTIRKLVPTVAKIMSRTVDSTFKITPPIPTKKKTTENRDQIDILRVLKEKGLLKEFVDIAISSDEAREWLREEAEQYHDTSAVEFKSVTAPMSESVKNISVDTLNIYHKGSSETIEELSELEPDKTLGPKLEKELAIEIEKDIMEIIDKMNDFYNDSQSSLIAKNLKKMPTVVNKNNLINVALLNDTAESEDYKDSKEAGLEIPLERQDRNYSDITYRNNASSYMNNASYNEIVFSKQDLIELFSEALKEEFLMKMKMNLTTGILFEENNTGKSSAKKDLIETLKDENRYHMKTDKEKL